MGATQQALLARAAAAGATGHRYWRLTNMSVASGDFQPVEIQLWEDSSTRADSAGTSLTTTASVVFGTIGRLVDGDVATTFVEFFPWDTAKIIHWDFGLGVTKAVTGFKHSDRGGGGVNNAFTTARLEYSDDDAAWTTFGNAAAIAFSAGALSAFIPFL